MLKIFVFGQIMAIFGFFQIFGLFCSFRKKILVFWTLKNLATLGQIKPEMEIENEARNINKDKQSLKNS